MSQETVKPTAQVLTLTPDGPAGYSKGIASVVGLVGAVLAALQDYLQDYLPQGSEWARWVGIGISVCATLTVFFVPNKTKEAKIAVVVDQDAVKASNTERSDRESRPE